MQPFVVKLLGLKPGVSVFDWHAGREFFELFGNCEILDADIDVSAELHYRGLSADVSCQLSGSVTVACDRCLEDLELAVETSFEQDYVLEGTELDISQDVYDYVCISLPLQRVHADGECNEETTKYLSK